MLVLHTPFLDGANFNIPKDDVLNYEADDDHHEQRRKNIRRIQVVALLKDHPTKAAVACRGTKYQLGTDQCPPSKCPTNLETGEAFLTENAERDEVRSTASGLRPNTIILLSPRESLLLD